MPFWENEQRELGRTQEVVHRRNERFKVELIRMNSQFRRIMEIREKVRQKALSSEDANQDMALLKEFWALLRTDRTAWGTQPSA